MVLGSCSVTAIRLMTLWMVKGPVNLGVNFLDSTQRGRSQVESHTLCPTWYTGVGVQRPLAWAVKRPTEHRRVARAWAHIR